MRRVVSVWLPTWPTDRLRRASGGALPPDVPLVTAAHDGRRRVIAAADAAARSLGLCPGLSLAHAQARVPGLGVAEADSAGDGAALERLAAWCLRRYTPLAAPDAPDGLWLDVSGCAPPHAVKGALARDGEQALLDDLTRCLARFGTAARAAVADTPGAAWAAAHFAASPLIVIPPGGQMDAIALLPIPALRLRDEAVAGLRRVGVDLVGQLATLPRAPLVRRFGPEVALRLEQALGRVFEPISPLVPAETIQCRLAFAEPLLAADALAAAIARLVPAVCAGLERAGQGARRLALLFERVDGHVQAVRVGTARPSRDARHLGRMLDERLETVDPGLGIEAMRLVVLLAESLSWSQPAPALAPGTPPSGDMSALVDRLGNRLGEKRVFRVVPVESDVPERAVRTVPAMEGAGAAAETAWTATPPRPVRLFRPPQPVQALAALPDRPPVAFTWRGVRRRVRRADGPERIMGEWWFRDREARAVRDYWAVEDEEGRRYWLYRRGDGTDRATGDLGWFLHGLF